MTSILLAFHGDPAVKSRYLSRVAAHAAADEIVKGQYWDDGKGCAVGCTLHSGEHDAYEAELGIPTALAYLEDDMFEAMPMENAKAWPRRFLDAIPVGADLSLVPRQYLAWMLRDLLTITDLTEDVRAAVAGMATLMERSLRGDEPSEAEWNDAERAAWAAWDARDAWDARAAWAAWAAWAARAVWDAWDARDARAAWDAWAARDARAAWDAWDARDAARAKHVLRHSEKLLELLAAAPVAGGEGTGMTGIHIHAPKCDSWGLRMLKCPTCQCRRRMLWTHVPWYGGDLVCLTCGERWQDGERRSRPFTRGWRAESVGEARRYLAQLKREMPKGTR